MESGVIVGIDHGGTTTTALVFDPESGQKRSSVSVSMPKQTPAVGWVEHAPEDFLNSGNEAANKALADADLKWNDVSAIGVANQGETSMAWSARSGEPLGPAISWEDRRTADICAELTNKASDYSRCVSSGSSPRREVWTVKTFGKAKACRRGARVKRRDRSPTPRSRRYSGRPTSCLTGS